MGDSHYKAEAMARDIPICPNCQKIAQEVKTKYGLRNKCCDLWSWDRHPLVDAETHAARNEAHKAFDNLWKSGATSRGNSYRLLREALGISKEQCHMKLMDAATAKRVPVAVAQIEQHLREMA